jgi:hypothetical protein
LTVFLCLTAGLFGQEGYRIEEDGRFVQTLRWQEEENALYYEVEIERQEGEAWLAAAEGETEEAFFEVSLTPGVYRYRVRVYDVLGKPAGEADWIRFEVYAAKQPQLSRFSPSVFYLDEDTVWVLDLSGRNLAEGAEIYLENQKAQGNLLSPQAVTVERSEGGARLVFNYGQLDPGEYTIHVVNPGGLKTSLGTFRIAFMKLVDVNISAGYRPLVPLYGRINTLFETGIFPLGAYGRLSVIPIKQRWGYVGIELEPAWNYLRVKGGEYEIQAQMAGGAVYGLYQWRFPNRVMALNFRAGGGVYSVLNYHFIYNRGDTEPITILVPAVAAGVSFQWFIVKSFFVEVGVDMTHFFAADKPQPGYFRPFIGAGWQF